MFLAPLLKLLQETVSAATWIVMLSKCQFLKHKLMNERLTLLKVSKRAWVQSYGSKELGALVCYHVTLWIGALKARVMDVLPTYKNDRYTIATVGAWMFKLPTISGYENEIFVDCWGLTHRFTTAAAAMGQKVQALFHFYKNTRCVVSIIHAEGAYQNKPVRVYVPADWEG